MERSTPFSIYDYFDYRKLLEDFHLLKKSLNPRWSQRLFALKAGIRSSGYLSEVLSGRRHLSKTQAQKFALAMDLGEKERAYFELLVAFARAKGEAARQAVYALLLSAMPVPVQRLRRSQLEYFSTWYHVAVREALAVFPVTGDGEELAEVLRPPITRTQARGALKLLSDLGLAARDGEGRWRATHASLLSPEDPGASLLLRAFHGEMMERAREALDRVPRDQRDVSGVTLSASPAGLARLKELVADFHRRVREAVQADRDEDRVLQLNLQLFPLTRHEADHAS